MWRSDSFIVWLYPVSDPCLQLCFAHACLDVDRWRYVNAARRSGESSQIMDRIETSTLARHILLRCQTYGETVLKLSQAA
jgi:hypothetical protein